MSEAAAADGSTPLLTRVVGFMSHLRANGMRVGTGDAIATAAFLAHAPGLGLDDVRRNLKVLLTRRHGEWERFDDLFEAYWSSRGRVRTRSARTDRRHAPAHAASRLWAKHLEGGTAGHGGAGGASETRDADHRGDTLTTRLAASSGPSLRRADLRHVADRDEMARAERLAYQLARAMRYRLSRRHRLASNGRRLDLRRTIRRNLCHGGDPLTLVRRRRADRPVRIVVMLDVSGSMQPYTRFLVQFTSGLVNCWPATDAFLFHTRLVHVTETLRERDPLQAMARLALIAGGIGGGTRLSESLREFNDHHAKRALDSRSIVLLLSDGYDTGDPAACVEQVARLKRRARRLVWLNPLLGWSRYEPVTRTMRAVLPYVDRFAPCHSLETLAALEPELAGL